VPATDLDGVPLVAWWIFQALAIVVTLLAAWRRRRCEAAGETRKANQLRINVGFGIFLCILIAVRLAVRA